MKIELWELGRLRPYDAEQHDRPHPGASGPRDSRNLPPRSIGGNLAELGPEGRRASAATVPGRESVGRLWRGCVVRGQGPAGQGKARPGAAW